MIGLIHNLSPLNNDKSESWGMSNVGFYRQSRLLTPLLRSRNLFKFLPGTGYHTPNLKLIVGIGFASGVVVVGACDRTNSKRKLHLTRK